MNEDYNLALELGILDGISQGNRYEWTRGARGRSKSKVEELDGDFFIKGRQRAFSYGRVD